MSALFQNDLILFIVFGVCIFTVSYLWSDKIISFLYDKSLGSRQEVIELMDKMFIETDKQKITLTLLLLSFGLGAIVFLLFWPNVVIGLIIGSGVTIVGWSIPKIIMRSLWEKRCHRIVAQMVDGMTIMSNGLKSGLSLQQSLDRVTENLTGPLAQEFQLMLNKIRLGMSLEDSMIGFAERIPMPDVQMFVSAVSVLESTGGNLFETFSTISYTIRERQKIHKKIEAMTASAITQGIIITCVPFVILVVFTVMDPNYIKPLFTTALGWFALGLMLVLQLIGGVVMRKIVTIKV